MFELQDNDSTLGKAIQQHHKEWIGEKNVERQEAIKNSSGKRWEFRLGLW